MVSVVHPKFDTEQTINVFTGMRIHLGNNL
jgi:hypothetical protein